MERILSARSLWLSASTVVAVRLRPHSGGEALQRHVESTIEVTLPSGYPEQAASVRLQRARGLVDDEESWRTLATLRALPAHGPPGGMTMMDQRLPLQVT